MADDWEYKTEIILFFISIHTNKHLVDDSQSSDYTDNCYKSVMEQYVQNKHILKKGEIN